VKIIDVEQGLVYAAGCWDIYAEVLALFVEKLPIMLTELSHLLEGQDYEQARIQVHSLRGMSAIVGAVALQEQAKLMEWAIQHHELDALPMQHGTLNELASQVLDAAQVVLQQGQRAFDHGTAC